MVNVMKIFEGRDAELYHATTIHSASKIIQTNTFDAISMHTFNGKSYHGVCLTRDYHFALVFRGECSAIFVLDQQKLYNNFKIKPYDYYQYHPYLPRRSHQSNPITAEAEEFVIGKISNADRYIISLQIKNNEWQKVLKMMDDPSKTDQWKKSMSNIIDTIETYKKVEFVR
jgi:hypothetical protein